MKDICQTYIKVRHYDDDDADVTLCTQYSIYDTAHVEIEAVGIPDEWKSTLNALSSGFYKVHYTVSLEIENGYSSFAYLQLLNILSVHRSAVAAFLFLLNHKIAPCIDFILDLFRPVWAVEIEWGGAGLRWTKMWLPQAIYFRLLPNTKALSSWGPKYTKVSLRRY